MNQALINIVAIRAITLNFFLILKYPNKERGIKKRDVPAKKEVNITRPAHGPLRSIAFVVANKNDGQKFIPVNRPKKMGRSTSDAQRPV